MYIQRRSSCQLWTREGDVLPGLVAVVQKSWDSEGGGVGASVDMFNK